MANIRGTEEQLLITETIIENKIIQFLNDMPSLMSKEETLGELREKFTSDFNITKIEQMEIEEYVVGHGRKDSFCYRLETELKELGDIHGSPSNKFGLYFGKDTQKYIFTKKYGTTEEEAFDEIKKQILKLISDGKNKDINAIRKNKLAPTVRGKILSVYYPNDYLCIFTDEHLDYFMNNLGIKADKSDDIINKQEKLIEWKKSRRETKDWTNHMFSNFLYDAFDRPPKKDANLNGKEKKEHELKANRKISITEIESQMKAIEELLSLEIEGTEREILTKARVNQGAFRERLLNKYSFCCLCGMNDVKLLIASHIKPWKNSDSKEKTDANNGLILCPHHDKLFDKGLISFKDNGDIIISDEIKLNNRILLNIQEKDKLNIDLSDETKAYLKWHRNNIFK